MRYRLRRTAASLFAAVLLTGAITSGSATASGTAASSGFDDWTCKPSAAHPNPLVLLHGLGGNGPGNYSYLGPFLAAKGYCAFTLTYGQATPAIPVGGTVSIAQSSAEIATFVQRVRTDDRRGEGRHRRALRGRLPVHLRAEGPRVRRPGRQGDRTGAADARYDVRRAGQRG